MGEDMKYRIVKQTYYDSIQFRAEKKRFGIWFKLFDMGLAGDSVYDTREKAIKCIERDRHTTLEEIEYV